MGKRGTQYHLTPGFIRTPPLHEATGIISQAYLPVQRTAAQSLISCDTPQELLLYKALERVSHTYYLSLLWHGEDTHFRRQEWQRRPPTTFTKQECNYTFKARKPFLSTGLREVLLKKQKAQGIRCVFPAPCFADRTSNPRNGYTIQGEACLITLYRQQVFCSQRNWET